MDIREWLPRITSPALVLGGDEDLMTPADQGPEGAGQQAIYEGIPSAEKHVIKGSNHSTVFDNTEEHNRVVIDFFTRHSRARLVPAVEEYGVEPIPAELRTARWPDLFAINFTFFLNPVMYVVGAIAVAGFGLPLWWAILAIVVGQTLAYAVMIPIAEVGVDYGLPGRSPTARSSGSGGAPAQLALPRDRGDVLVRRAGDRAGLRDPGRRAGDGRRSRR